MGTWGTGPFENDNALDWLAELSESGDARLIPAALRRAAAADAEVYLEGRDADAAMAAAEMVAALLGRSPVADAEPDVASVVRDARGRGDPLPPPALVSLARSAIARVAAPQSELAELWDETEDLEAWRGVIADLDARLAG